MSKIEIKATESFYEDLEELTEELQKKTFSKLKLFQKNTNHPSLRVKKIKGTDYIWEMSINMQYRVTFQWKNETTIILRRVGTHDILQNP
ncbi:MAG: cytotoxin [Candidatus Magasanikbacteria bacterium]